MRRLIILILLILASTFASIYAQYVEDALRYAKNNMVVSPRAAGLNVSFYGVSDDASALLYNVAGLSLIPKSELSLGIGFTRNNSETEYLSFNNILKTNVEAITNAVLVSVFDIGKDRKPAAVGIGYFLEDDFANVYRFSGFNDKYTMIASEADFGPRNPNDNWAYQLYLADEFQQGNQTSFLSPYRDSLTQSGNIVEKGGLHNVTAGLAYDVNEYVALGFSLTGKWGNYSYNRTYNESDPSNIYTNVNVGGYVFNNLQTIERLEQQVSGISGSVNLMAKLENFLRFGATVKFPTWYQFDENFSATYTAKYKNHPERFYKYDGKNSFNLRTPFIYAAGVSLHTLGLTFSAGVEYSDVTQMEFSDAIPEVLMLNDKIIMELVGQTTWGFGTEYHLPIFPGVVRLSYSKTTSPYHQDIPNAGIDNFSIGGSVFISNNVRVDGVMRWVDYAELRTTYRAPYEMQQHARYILNKSPLNLMFGIAYRF